MDILAQINRKKTIVAGIAVIVMLAAILIFAGDLYGRQSAVNAEENGLNATGSIQATTVMASFKVPGKIEKELVDEGGKVESGQEIALLEGQEINSDLNAAQGAFKAAQGQAQEAAGAVPLTSQQVETTISQAQAQVDQAQIGVKSAQQQYERASALFKEGYASQKDLDDATDAYNLAQAKLAQAQAGLAQAMSARLNVQIAESKYNAAQGAVIQADGAVQKAQAYLADTHLLAPISGYVTAKYLETGEMLNAGTPVYEITDLANTYVKVYISETKIGRVHLGQEAQIQVDAYPNRTFKGKVVLINDAGEFAVQKAVNDQYEHDIRSFEVKVSVPNTDLALKTGMTARVKILEEAAQQ
jgi:HlyD family secretion protein